MRANVRIRFALTSALVALLVAFATLRFANAADSSGWLLAGGGGCSCIDVYSQSGHHQPLKAQMNVGAFALSVDASQTLYAGQELRDGSYGVAVYPPGSKVPTREIDTPFVGGRATSLVVQADGTLYVGGDWGQLFEYLPGASQPVVSVVVAPSITGTLQGLSVDPRSHELYLSMNNQCCHLYSAILYRLSADLVASTALRTVPWQPQASLAVDAQGNLIVGLRHGIGVYAHGTWSQTRFFGFDSPVTALAYDSAHDLLYVGGGPGIRVYQYSTGRLANTITSGWSAGDVPSSLVLDPTMP